MEASSIDTVKSQTDISPSEEKWQGTSFLRTCFNGLNALSGVGMLSIPYALSQGGWLSLIILFVVAILCFYTGLLLRRCMDSNPIIKTYPDIGSVAFGSKGRAMISTFMYIELYLVAVEFLILEGDNLHKLFPDVNFHIAGISIPGKQGFVLLTALVVLPTTWLRSLGLLAYISAGGVLASIILVLLVCFVLSTISYGSMAILGYLMYGGNLISQVTLNLPTKNISSKVAIYTTLINPITKYAIVVSPINAAIEDTFPLLRSRSLTLKIRLISLFIRTVVVISTVLVALAVPFFGYVMAFTGAFLGTTVSMLLPSIFYLKINKDARKFGPELVIIILILLAGSSVAAVGTYTSLHDIVNHAHSN
ncbi:hypothetical protein AgCh_026531 [Apium graveolens]